MKIKFDVAYLLVLIIVLSLGYLGYKQALKYLNKITSSEEIVTTFVIKEKRTYLKGTPQSKPYIAKSKGLGRDGNIYIFDVEVEKRGTFECLTLKGLYDILAVGNARASSVKLFKNSLGEVVYCHAY